MIKLKSLLLELRNIPVVIGIVSIDKGILSSFSTKSHSELGYHYGSKWRYNPETKIVYWSALNHGDQTADDMNDVENHLYKKYNYKVEDHIDMGDSIGKTDIYVSHGRMG